MTLEVSPKMCNSWTKVDTQSLINEDLELLRRLPNIRSRYEGAVEKYAQFPIYRIILLETQPSTITHSRWLKIWDLAVQIYHGKKDPAKVVRRFKEQNRNG